MVEEGPRSMRYGSARGTGGQQTKFIERFRQPVLLSLSLSVDCQCSEKSFHVSEKGHESLQFQIYTWDASIAACVGHSSPAQQRLPSFFYIFNRRTGSLTLR